MIMESCWLIEFRNGYRMIISEELYEQEKKEDFGGRPILVEQHWFVFEVCRKKNRSVPVFGMPKGE
jgi:hypothetical protein